MTRRITLTVGDDVFVVIKRASLRMGVSQAEVVRRCIHLAHKNRSKYAFGYDSLTAPPKTPRWWEVWKW